MSWRRKTFEVLPALSVRRRYLRLSMRTVTLAWMFGIVWMACISGSQMTLFCRMLGFTNRDFGILAALPWAATLAQLPAAVAIERTGLRKYPVVFYASIHRILWIAIAAVPFLFQPGKAAISVFLGIFGISCVLAHLSVPRWQMWMGDLIPRRVRGRFFAARSLRTLPIQVMVVITAGILLDRATVPGEAMTVQAQPALLWTICGIFVVAAVFGAIDSLLHLRIREIVSPSLTNGAAAGPRRGVLGSIGAGLLEPVRVVAGSFRDRRFRHYALYGAAITFSITVAGQFFWLYALKNAGFSKLGANAVFLVVPAVSSILMVRLWGRLVDRWGRRPVLILATAGTVFTPVWWFFMPAGQVPLAYLLGTAGCLIGGTMWMGIGLAQTSIILGFSETAGRSKYIAAAAVAAAVGGFAGGLAGGEIAEYFEYLQKEPICIGPFRWVNYHVNFLVSMSARIVSILLVIGMSDPGAKPFRDVVRQMRFNAYNNVMTRMFWRLRTPEYRRRQRSHTGKGKDTDRPA